MPYAGQPEKMFSGEWDSNTSWDFYSGRTLPEDAICTSVSCLALLDEGRRLVVTRNHRGLEMPGGHIEPGETLAEALARESLEEAGYHPSRYEQYGYRRISSKTPVANEHHGGTYPPVTYIAHFVAETDRPLELPTGPQHEVYGRCVIDSEKVGEIAIVQLPFILAGLAAYRAIRAENRQLGNA